MLEQEGAAVPPEVAAMTAQEKDTKRQELELKRDVQIKTMELLGYVIKDKPDFKDGRLQWVGQGGEHSEAPMDTFRRIYDALDSAAFGGDTNKMADHIVELMKDKKYFSQSDTGEFTKAA